jgi:hypothetical protein
MFNPFANFPPVEPERVRIFTDTTELAEYDYERVAVLNASGDYKWINDEDMYEAIRKKAGEIGANAVLYVQAQDPTTEEKVWNILVRMPADRKAEVVAIFVRNPDWY